jgi:hypothetical protein
MINEERKGGGGCAAKRIFCLLRIVFFHRDLFGAFFSQRTQKNAGDLLERILCKIF